jgi:hypothetical protein
MQLGLQIWTRPHYGFPSPATAREEALIHALRADLGGMARPAPEASSESERLWSQFQERLRNAALTRDPRGFLTWDVITRTMFLAFSSYAAKEFFHLRRRPDWLSRWKPAIRESPAGRPAPFPLYPRTSANLVHDAYALCRFEESTGAAIEEFDEVLEFGGGYGSLCRLFFNLGFQGTYTIYDLPPFSSLQSYFLKSVGIPVRRGDLLAGTRNGVRPNVVRLLSSEQELAQLSRSAPKGKSLFVAAWSLSETPLEVRQQFLPYVEHCDAYLLAYQSRFGEMDNCEFFGEWKEKTVSTISWRQVALPHIPGRHTFLFGTRGPSLADASREISEAAT